MDRNRTHHGIHVSLKTTTNHCRPRCWLSFSAHCQAFILLHVGIVEAVPCFFFFFFFWFVHLLLLLVYSILDVLHFFKLSCFLGDLLVETDDNQASSGSSVPNQHGSCYTAVKKTLHYEANIMYIGLTHNRTTTPLSQFSLLHKSPPWPCPCYPRDWMTTFLQFVFVPFVQISDGRTCLPPLNRLHKSGLLLLSGRLSTA